MKINDVKHNHSLTDLLKILLFAILMLAPIGSVATRCLYVVCNKNAYQSYSDEMIEATQSINNSTQIQVGDIITWNYQTATITQTTDTAQINFSELSFNPTDYGFSDLQYERISFSSRTNAQYVFLYQGTTYYYKNIWGTDLTTITIKVASGTNSGSLVNDTTLCYKTTFTSNHLDNVFEYSVSQLENDQLFSWTSNTPVYTGINAMCTQLGITGQAIPIILSYWLILTCIYVVIDIVIKLFTLLTHLIGRKAQ